MCVWLCRLESGEGEGWGGRGEGWVYSVYLVLDYGMGRHLGAERNKPNENTVLVNYNHSLVLLLFAWLLALEFTNTLSENQDNIFEL